MIGEIPKILLIEDNPADIELTREAFEESNVVNCLDVIEDGGEVIEHLLERAGKEESELPELILLDINLPHVSGLELLKQIKEHDDLKHIPVIMLTSSEDDLDITESYQNYCSGYVTKPVNISDFIRIISGIENFWFALVKLPNSHHPKE